LTLDDLKSQYCHRNCIGRSVSSLATARLLVLFLLFICFSSLLGFGLCCQFGARTFTLRYRILIHHSWLFSASLARSHCWQRVHVTATQRSTRIGASRKNTRCFVINNGSTLHALQPSYPVQSFLCVAHYHPSPFPSALSRVPL